MIKIYVGDCREVMASLPANSVNVCVTSPPYWSHREYKTPELEWGDGWAGHLGNEPSPDQYCNHMLEICMGVREILHPTGTFWLNLGDTYARQAGGTRTVTWANTGQQRVRDGGEGVKRSHKPPPGYKAKDLIGIPWMVATALRESGWWLRMDNIWAKGVSGQRELTAAVYQAVLDEGFPPFIAERIATRFNPFVGNPTPDPVKDRPTKAHEHVFLLAKSAKYYYDYEGGKEPAEDGGIRNRRSVWTIPTRGYKGAHFAVMTQALADMCVSAGAGKEGRCSVCKTPIDWRLECKCAPCPIEPCVILDPFGGSGTTAIAAHKYNCDAILIELSQEYAELAATRILEETGEIATLA